MGWSVVCDCVISSSYSYFYELNHILDIVLIFLHGVVLRGYWVLTESRIPLKPVIAGMRNVLGNRLNKTESIVFFIMYVLSISKGSVFQIIKIIKLSF